MHILLKEHLRESLHPFPCLIEFYFPNNMFKPTCLQINAPRLKETSLRDFDRSITVEM